MNPLKSIASVVRAPSLRRGLERTVRERAPGTPLRIVVGAHRIFEPGWIPTEREALDLLKPESWTRYFREGEIDAILAEHVWEHLDREQAVTAAKTCLRFLKPGGHLRVAVPDGLHPSPEYIQRVRPGGTGPAAWDHKILYDYRTFPAIFREAGFEPELLEWYDTGHELHRTEWDPEDGMIHRSWRFDKRTGLPYRYTSLILDARKPA